MSTLDIALHKTNALPEVTDDEILRFRTSERQMHWAVAIPFMICYSTAIVLITIYNPHPERPYRAVVSWIHRGSGLALFTLPLWTIIQHWYDAAIHRENIWEVWRWTVADLKWLFLMGPSTISKKIVLPDQGKFNAAEKINFMMLMTTLPLYLVSGLAIWFHQYVFSAWVLHLSLAAIATVLMGGHIFMATVNPDTRVGLSGMVTGYVSRHWASHHYAHWYRKNYPIVVSVKGAAIESPIESPAHVGTEAEHAPSFETLPEVPAWLVTGQESGVSDGIDDAESFRPSADGARAGSRQLRLVVAHPEHGLHKPAPAEPITDDSAAREARRLPPFMYPRQSGSRTKVR